VSSLTKAQQKQIVKQWGRAGRELERIHRRELREWTYDWTTVDALLDAGTRTGGAPRPTSGLVEWQRWMAKLADQRAS
jgi:hypothetical protein